MDPIWSAGHFQEPEKGWLRPTQLHSAIAGTRQEVRHAGSSSPLLEFLLALQS